MSLQVTKGQNPSAKHAQIQEFQSRWGWGWGPG